VLARVCRQGLAGPAQAHLGSVYVAAPALMLDAVEARTTRFLSLDTIALASILSDQHKADMDIVFEMPKVWPPRAVHACTAHREPCMAARRRARPGAQAALLGKEALAARRTGAPEAGFTDDGFALGLAFLLRVPPCRPPPSRLGRVGTFLSPLECLQLNLVACMHVRAAWDLLCGADAP
jgi:hypothetical protein